MEGQVGSQNLKIIRDKQEEIMRRGGKWEGERVTERERERAAAGKCLKKRFACHGVLE